MSRRVPIHPLVAGIAAALAFLTAARGPLHASDLVGIYGIIDKVVLEPAGSEAPERIQIWGTFVFSGQGHNGSGPFLSENGGYYELPQRGYLYYSLPPGSEETARIEWNDLKSVAGRAQCIGFSNRYDENKGKVRPFRETPAKPDVYVLSSIGLTQVSNSTTNPPPRALLNMPTPMQPPSGGSAAPGPVMLAVRIAPHPDAADAGYYFEIENSAGDVERSPRIDPFSKLTQWTPQMPVQLHDEYIWRAWTEGGAGASQTTSDAFIPYFVRGQINPDDAIDISDAVALLIHLFLGGAAPRPSEAGDVDGNGALEVTDSIHLLMHLFRGGPEPFQPYPVPGPKP